jgi:hypothetical protein
MRQLHVSDKEANGIEKRPINRECISDTERWDSAQYPSHAAITVHPVLDKDACVAFVDWSFNLMAASHPVPGQASTLWVQGPIIATC